VAAAIDFLRKQWKEEALYRPFHPYLHIDDDGLTLGAGTRLAPMSKDRTGAPFLVIDDKEERILALLSLAYRKRIPVTALKFIKRASLQWMNGEKALAHFELAYAQLPRFEARAEAKPLFYAEGLVNLGLSPRALMRSHDLDTRELDLLKYSADQPRVPAGNGRESGEWTSGDGRQYAQNKPWNPFLPFQTLPVGGSDGEGGGWRGGSGEGTKAGEAEGVTSIIEIPSGRFGQAAEHAQDAINAGQPDTLTIDRARAAENRLAATGGLEKVPGMHLDEYPPAMFEEGGAGASVRAISPHDNMSLGAYIGVCCRRLPDGGAHQDSHW
jgi:hypothetical protein